MSKKIENMTDEELAALEADLAEQRTKVRLQQNAVSAEQELRRAMAGMSTPAKEALTLRLNGEAQVKGDRS